MPKSEAPSVGSEALSRARRCRGARAHHRSHRSWATAGLSSAKPRRPAHLSLRRHPCPMPRRIARHRQEDRQDHEVLDHRLRSAPRACSISSAPLDSHASIPVSAERPRPRIFSGRGAGRQRPYSQTRASLPLRVSCDRECDSVTHAPPTARRREAASFRLSRRLGSLTVLPLRGRALLPLSRPWPLAYLDSRPRSLLPRVSRHSHARAGPWAVCRGARCGTTPCPKASHLRGRRRPRPAQVVRPRRAPLIVRYAGTRRHRDRHRLCDPAGAARRAVRLLDVGYAPNADARNGDEPITQRSRSNLRGRAAHAWGGSPRCARRATIRRALLENANALILGSIAMADHRCRPRAGSAGINTLDEVLGRDVRTHHCRTAPVPSPGRFPPRWRHPTRLSRPRCRPATRTCRTVWTILPVGRAGAAGGPIEPWSRSSDCRRSMPLQQQIVRASAWRRCGEPRRGLPTS